MKKWFTIIELVIAILIFWIWLLTVLIVLNKNIIFAKKVELKTQATFLAKEWIEFVYNVRDSNKIKYYPRNFLSWTNDDIKNNTYEKFSVKTIYIPYIYITWYKISLIKVNNIKDTRLYNFSGFYTNPSWENIYSWEFYNYSTGKKTPFSRYITFSWVLLWKEWWVADINQILKLKSKVFYSHWSITWKVIFNSIIWDWR